MDKLMALLKQLGAKDDQIEGIKAELESAQEEAVAGLKAKNIELLGKLKKNQGNEDSKAAELETKLEELQESMAKSKKEYETAIKKLTGERDTFEKAASSEKGAVERLLIDGGVTEALSKAGYKPEHIPAIKALLRERGALSVKADGDNRKAIAKLLKEGKEVELPIEDYITKEFAASVEGKAFMPAGGNSGTGAGGSGSGGAAGKKWAEMSLKEQSELFKSNPTLAKQLQSA